MQTLTDKLLAERKKPEVVKEVKAEPEAVKEELAATKQPIKKKNKKEKEGE